MKYELENFLVIVRNIKFTFQNPSFLAHIEDLFQAFVECGIHLLYLKLNRKKKLESRILFKYKKGRKPIIKVLIKKRDVVPRCLHFSSAAPYDCTRSASAAVYAAGIRLSEDEDP